MLYGAESTHTHLQYHQTWVVRRAIVLEMSAEHCTPTFHRNGIEFFMVVVIIVGSNEIDKSCGKKRHNKQIN